MDVGVVDIQSRKEKRQQELSALIAEAKKSVVDPVTGKCRCLSCGHVVRSVRALADHLRKHDGVNSVVYRPPRIVGASSEAYDRQAVARPAAMQLGDFVNVALRTESRSQTEKRGAKNGTGGTAEVSCPNNAPRNDRRESTSRKKNKTTPMKRSILIAQVLSLTTKLQSLQEDLGSLSKRQHRRTDGTSDVTKKEVKKLRGCINSTACELQMALAAVNRKFTFRQLVMIEYLTDHLKLMDSVFRDGAAVSSMGFTDDEIGHNDDDTCINTMKPATDNNILELYREIDELAQVVFNSHETQGHNRGRREHRRERIETQKDDASAHKNLIRRPVFAEDAFVPHTEGSESLNVTEQGEKEKEKEKEAAQAGTNEDVSQKMSEEDSRDPFLSSPEMSSDGGDEMLGFSDVLAEWAKQTRHYTRETPPPLVSHFFHTDRMDDAIHKTTSQTETLYRPCDEDDPCGSQNTEVRVIHIGRNDDKPCETIQELTVHGGNDAWHVEADGKPLKSRCIFIRPHLASSNKIESDHPPSYNTPGREKSTKKKKQPPSPVGPLSDRPASIESPKDNKVATSSPQPFETLDDAVHFLLSRLNELQHIHMKSNNGESSSKWLISGLAEVSRHLKREGEVKLVIVANNLDTTIQPKLDKLYRIAEEHGVPVVVALSRRKIGRIYHHCKRMGVVAVLNYQDLHQIFHTILHLSQKQQY